MTQEEFDKYNMRRFKAICAAMTVVVLMLPLVLIVLLIAIVKDLHDIIVYRGTSLEKDITELETYEILDMYKDCIYLTYIDIKRG